MSVPEGDKLGELPLDELVQNASQQALALAREQVDVARRELAARASQAGPGAAMVGGGALLAALASGTGTAALILLLARRPRASAAALGVTGAYAGVGAVLAREGIGRLREAGPQPDAPVQGEPVQNSKQGVESAKRRTKSAAKSRPRPAGRPKPQSKKPSSRRRASGTQTDRTRGERLQPLVERNSARLDHRRSGGLPLRHDLSLWRPLVGQLLPRPRPDRSKSSVRA